MKPVTFRLDRRLYDLLQDGELQRFTIRKLRDSYAERSGETLLPPSTELWHYIYAQVGRLKRTGWVRADAERRRRDQVYYVEATPNSLRLVLIDSPHSGSHLANQNSVWASGNVSTSEPVQRLEALAKEIRLDMLSSLGEAERYKQLIAEIPQLKDHVADEYHEAKDRSSRLLGHLKAVETTLRLLVKE